MPDSDRRAAPPDLEPLAASATATPDAYGSENADRALIERIRALLLDSLDLSAPTPEADLIESGVLDSLALVELLFELERTFEIDVMVEELDIEHFRSVARIASFVAAQRPARRQAS